MNSYVLLTLEGKFFGGSPVVHLYLRENDTTPFLSSPVDGTRDHTLGKGSQYRNGTGEQFLCGPVVDDRSIECAYFYAGQTLDGFLDMSDLTNRYSNKMFFKNIAPLICAADVDVGGAVGSLLQLSSNGSTLLAIEGAFFGARTWATVDGIVCDNQPAFMQQCYDAGGMDAPCDSPAASNVTRREYLYPAYGVDMQNPRCPALALQSSEAQPKIVKCVAPVGYGVSRSLVIYNGNQPSSAKFISYLPPVITGVSATVVPTSGVDQATHRRVNVSVCAHSGHPCAP